MTSPRLIVIGGGVRCGKSAFALELARGLSARRAFIATAQAFDAEMRERIDRHVAERGREFETHEVPLDLVGTLARLQSDVVVIDCLTLWLSNQLLQVPLPSTPELEHAIDALVDALARRTRHVIVVTNEVGMGVVPESALGRQFRDLAGRAHQRVCAEADEIYLGMLGCMLRLRPEPIALVSAAPGGRAE